MLHVDHEERRCLTARELLIEEKELSTLPSTILVEALIRDPDASLLVPILQSSLTPGGVLVIGGRKCLFFELSTLADESGRTRKKKRHSNVVLHEHENDTARNAVPRASVEWPFSTVTT
jgi:hypothetical protein